MDGVKRVESVYLESLRKERDWVSVSQWFRNLRRRVLSEEKQRRRLTELGLGEV